MTVSTTSFLKKCQKLSELGMRFEIEQGNTIARGFADLGFEEFALLSSEKMISLYTGQTSLYDAQQGHHFFLVPNCDQMIDKIVTAKFDIIGLQFIDQRNWKLDIKNISDASDHSYTAESMADVLITCLIDIVKK